MVRGRLPPYEWQERTASGKPAFKLPLQVGPPMEVLQWAPYMRKKKNNIHLCKHVTHDFAIVVFTHVEKLRPGQHVIEVIFHLIVLGQAHQVAGLHK